jgi:serine/threonine-protein kinase
MDSEGKFTPLRKTVGHYSDLAFSPDGKRLAVAAADGGKTDIWIDDLERDSLTRATFDGDSRYPFWSPDGQRIVYASRDKGFYHLWWTRADGSGQPQRLTESSGEQFPGSLRPDGKVLAFFQVTGTNYDIMTLPMDGDEKSGWKPEQPVRFSNGHFIELLPAFSPDGHWLAYTSVESGRPEVYLRPFPGPGGKWQVSTTGGVQPEWSPNGKQLFYKNVEATKISVVSYTTSGDTFHAGTPQTLPGQLPSAINSWNFSLHPDGKRFAVLKAPDTGASNTARVNIVLNWMEELKQKAPAGTK